MSLDSVARRAGGKAGTRERERKYGSGLCLSEGIPEKVVFEVMPERRINCLLSLNFVRLG